MDIVTDVYAVEDNADSEQTIVDVPSEVVEQSIVADPVTALSDRELLIATYKQQVQIGAQLNWLCENLNGVFGMVTAMSQNGGGVRGLMKVMKEMNANG
jgi:hypothetical protein